MSYQDRILKRTIDGKRVLIGICFRRRQATEKLLKAHQSEYLALWRKTNYPYTITDSERKRLNDLDQALGESRRDESKVIGKWEYAKDGEKIINFN